MNIFFLMIKLFSCNMATVGTSRARNITAFVDDIIADSELNIYSDNASDSSDSDGGKSNSFVK